MVHPVYSENGNGRAVLFNLLHTNMYNVFPLCNISIDLTIAGKGSM